jgi:hypothetical protein
MVPDTDISLPDNNQIPYNTASFSMIISSQNIMDIHTFL